MAYGENSKKFVDTLALRRAAQDGFTAHVVFLKEEGADPHDGNDAALKDAAYYGHTDTVVELLEGASEEAIQWSLKFARQNQKTHTVKILEEALAGRDNNATPSEFNFG